MESAGYLVVVLVNKITDAPSSLQTSPFFSLLPHLRFSTKTRIPPSTVVGLTYTAWSLAIAQPHKPPSRAVDASGMSYDGACTVTPYEVSLHDELLRLAASGRQPAGTP